MSSISTDLLSRLGEPVLHLLANTGSLWRLAVASVKRFASGVVNRTLRLGAAADQAILAGNNSLALVALICLLVGMITALQSAYQLEELGAAELVAALVSISITRELAPLLTAVIVTGRYGSAITAELGSMKVSQEIDALTVMGIDPIDFLVLPRLIALMIALPCLTVFADVMGILGGLVVAVGVLDMGATGYLADTLDALALQDIYAGLVKALAFGVIIGLVGCDQGLSTRGGAAEVGRATTAAVVISIVLVIGADLLVTAFFYARG